MATKTVLDAIKKHLQDHEVIKNRNSVKVHAGKFTWSELKRHGFKTPSLYISCLGWKEAREDDAAALPGYELAVEARFVIGVVTSDSKSPESRNILARGLAETLCLQLIQQDWNLDNCLVAKDRRSEGLFVPAAEQENSSLWLVSWNQVVAMNRDDLQSSIDDWLRYQADHYDENDPNHLMAADTVEITTT